MNSERKCKSGGSAYWRMVAGGIAAWLVTSVAAAQTAYLPSMKTIAGTRVSTATTYYGTSTTHTNGLGTTSRSLLVRELARGLGSEQVTGGQLTAAAYAQTAFEYVRQNIKPVWMFGLQKGATGAIIDQAGTSFDQADLLVQLLREAGITANYQYGSITLDPSQVEGWMQLSHANATCKFLADGGIPIIVNETNTSGCNFGTDVEIASLKMAHLWVTAPALGLVFDPAFKQTTRSSGMNLAATLNCGTSETPTCGSQSVTAATPALAADRASIGGAPAWKNIRYGLLSDRLTQFASNLKTHLDQTSPDALIEDVLPLISIDSSTLETPSSSLQYANAGSVSWTEIPNQFRSTLRVQFDNIDQTLYADEIYGQRLKIFGKVTGNGTGPVPRNVGLYLEYRLLASSNRSDGTLANDTLTLTVNHPYAASSGAYADETIAFRPYAQVTALPVFSPVAIIHGWGDTGTGAIAHFGGLASRNYTDINVIDPSNPNHTFKPSSAGGSLDCNPTGGIPMWVRLQAGGNNVKTSANCLGLALHTVAAQWMAQDSRTTELVGAVNNARIQNHHSLGWLTDCGPCGMSMSIEYTRSTRGLTDDATDRKAAMMSLAALSSRLEGSQAEQTGGAWEGVSGISLLKRANEAGIPLMQITSGNVSTANAALQNFPAEVKTLFTQQVASPNNFTFIVPRNWHIGPFTVGGQLTFTIGAYTGTNSNGDRSTYAVGSEGLKGSSSVTASDPLSDVNRSVAVRELVERSAKSFGVDSVTGSMTFSPPADLVTGTGSFPTGLEFRRTFNSGRPSPVINGECMDLDLGGGLTCVSVPVTLADAEGFLGNGWSHNYDINASISSDAFQAMGEDSAVDAVSTVAALYTLRTLYRSSQSIGTRITSMFVADWWASGLQDNAVVVKMPNTSYTFIRLPGATPRFNSPPKTAAILTQTGARTGPAGGGSPAISYFYSNIDFTLTEPDGSNLSFDFAYSTVSGSVLETIGKKSFRPTQWSFPSGVVVTFEHGAGSWGSSIPFCLRKVSNNLGRSLTYESVGSRCRLSKVTDETGRSVFWDPALTLPGVNTFTAVDGTRTRYEQEALPFDAPFLGHRFTKVFTDSSSDPFIDVAYDAFHRVRRVVDARGNETRYYSASLGSERVRRGESLAGPQLGVRKTQYSESHGLPASTIDALGRASYNYYDSRQRLKRVVHPELNETVYDHDSRGNVIEIRDKAKPGSGLPDIVQINTYLTDCTALTRADCNSPQRIADARGNETIFEWNQTTGLLTSITAPTIAEGAPYTEFRYTPHAAVAPETGTIHLMTSKFERVSATPLVQTETRYDYDPANKLTLDRVTVDFGGKNIRTSFDFDAQGGVRTVDGPRVDVSDVTTYTYDAMRRITRVDAPLNHVTRYTYDTDGQLSTTRRARVANPTDPTPTHPRPNNLVDSQWQIERRTYHPTGELDTTIDPEGQTTERDYDYAGRLEYLRQPIDSLRNRVTRFVYDAAGQKVEAYHAWGAADQYRHFRMGYTPNGKVDWSEDAIDSGTPGALTTGSGNRTDNVYDGHDRLRRIVFPHPDTGVPNSGCDVNLEACTPNDFEQFTYDADGHIERKRTRAGAEIVTVFDEVGLVRTVTVPGNTALPSGRVITTTYDLLSRKKNVTAEGQTIAHFYDSGGRLDYITDSYLGANNLIDYTFDDTGNRSNVVYPGGRAIAYTYDALNRIDLITDDLGVTIADYDYDILARRERTTFGNGATTVPQYYDDSALRVVTHNVPSRSVAYDFGRNRNNEITSMTVTVPSPAGSWNEAAFIGSAGAVAATSYDANALNQYDSVGGVNYDYDAQGNLITDGVWTYGYDAENRLRTAVRSSAPAMNIRYEYDPLGRRRAKVVNGTRTIYASDGAEEIEERTAGNTVLRSYVYGTAVDERLAMIDFTQCGTGGHCFYLVNHQGSTIAFTNQQGAVVDTYSYDPYGNAAVSGTGNPFRYTGRRYDEETGLYYYRARYYSPKLGRFLQTDPIGNADDFNLYAYVSNDPVNRTDPTGLQDSQCPQGDTTCAVGEVANETEQTAQNLQVVAATVEGAAKSPEFLTAAGADLEPLSIERKTIEAIGDAANDAGKIADKAGNGMTGVQAVTKIAQGDGKGAAATVTGAMIDKAIGRGVGAIVTAAGQPELAIPAGAAAEALSGYLGIGEALSGPVIDAVVAAPGQVYNAAFEASLPMMNEVQNAVKYSPVFGNPPFGSKYGEDTFGGRW